MIDDKDKEILAYLRRNSRITMNEIAYKMNMPISTVYNRIRKMEENLVIKRHTSLCNFDKLNYPFRINFVIETNDKNGLFQFLVGHQNVNSLYRIKDNSHLLVDCVFKKMNDVEAFKEEVNKFQVKKIDDYYVIEELVNEAFFTKKDCEMSNP